MPERNIKVHVGMKALAHHVGVSKAAVSMALRDMPGISLALRERVKKAALEIGYQRSAALSKVMSAAGSRGKQRFRETIGCVAFGTPLDQQRPSSQHWQAAHLWRQQILSGFRSRAETLGCVVSHFAARQDNIKALTRTMRARGIDRLVILNYPQPFDDMSVLEVLMREFRCIFIGESRFLGENVLVVRADLYAAGQMAFLRGWRAGCTRFILASEFVHLDRDRRFEAGVRFASILLDSRAAFTFEHASLTRPDVLHKLLNTCGPDTLLIGMNAPTIPVKEVCARSRQGGPYFLDWHASVDPSSGFAGIDQRDFQQAEAAITISLGVSAMPEGKHAAHAQHLIHPVWQEGLSMPIERAPEQSIELAEAFPASKRETYTTIPLPQNAYSSFNQLLEGGILGTRPPPFPLISDLNFCGIPFKCEKPINKLQRIGAIAIGTSATGHVSVPRVTIPVNLRTEALYFLHAAAYSEVKKPMAWYSAHTSDGAVFKVPLQAPAPIDAPTTRPSNDCTIDDWWPMNRQTLNLSHLRTLRLIDTDASPWHSCNLYVFRMQLPRCSHLVSIEAEAVKGSPSIILLFGVTAAIGS